MSFWTLSGQGMRRQDEYFGLMVLCYQIYKTLEILLSADNGSLDQDITTAWMLSSKLFVIYIHIVGYSA